MSTSPDDLETRVTALEHKVADIAQDAAAARVLAKAADRDVSEMHTELRGHTRVLNALRETQNEQGKEIKDLRREMREGFAAQGQRIDGLESEMRQGFATAATQLSRIVALLENPDGEAG